MKMITVMDNIYEVFITNPTLSQGALYELTHFVFEATPRFKKDEF